MTEVVIKPSRKPVAEFKSPSLGASLRKHLIDPAVAVSETALTLGSGMTTSAVAGLSGLGKLATTGSLDAASEEVKRVQQLGTYIPRSSLGKELLSLVGKVAEKIPTAGDPLYEATGSPAAGTVGTFLDPTMLVPALKAGGVSIGASLAAMMAIDKAATVKGVDISSKVPRIARGQEGLIKGQEVFRGTERAVPDTENLSRRLTDPGKEGGMHVSVDPNTAEIMKYNYLTGEEGSVLKMTSKVKTPYWVEDTGGTWRPHEFVDQLLNRVGPNLDNMERGSKGMLSKQARKKLVDISDEYRSKLTNRQTMETPIKKLDQLDTEYNKKIQQVLKEEGYDHVSYINTREGHPVESAIIFDKAGVEYINSEPTNFIKPMLVELEMTKQQFKNPEAKNLLFKAKEQLESAKRAASAKNPPQPIPDSFYKSKEKLAKQLLEQAYQLEKINPDDIPF